MLVPTFLVFIFLVVILAISYICYMIVIKEENTKNDLVPSKSVLSFNDIKLKSEQSLLIFKASKESCKLYYELFDLVCLLFEKETGLNSKDFYKEIIKSKYLIGYIKTICPEGYWMLPNTDFMHCCDRSGVVSLINSPTYEDILKINNDLKNQILYIKELHKSLCVNT